MNAGSFPPLLTITVPAGFPSPANDHFEREIDLNAELIQHPAATFFVRVEGHSMEGAGITDGDVLIVDRAVPAVDGKIVVASIDGEFTVKRLRRHQGQIRLEAASDHPDRIIRPDEALDIWGVVTYVIHKC